MIIYRPSDRIPVRIDTLTLWVSPLTYEQKTNLLSLSVNNGGKETKDLGRSSFLTLKYAIKQVDCFEATLSDGTQAVLEYGPDQCLTDESLEMLLAVLGVGKAISISQCVAVSVFTDKLDGIVFDLENVAADKKKTS